MISTDTDPVLNGLRLRTGLRSARSKAHMSQGAVGTRLHWSAKKVYRIEAGETPASVDDVSALAELYGLDPRRTRELVDLAAAAFGAVWWERFRALVSPEFGLFLSCERAATELSSFHPTLIQGLIQTEEYARAMLSSTSDPMDLQQRVRLRQERRDVLDRPRPPRVKILLGEAALHNQVGDAGVMRRQLLELRRLAVASPIELGIVPFEQCLYPPMLIGFDLARLPDGELSLHLELPPVSRTTKDEAILNDLYSDFFAQISTRTLFGADAAALIDAILDQRARGDCDRR